MLIRTKAKSLYDAFVATAGPDNDGNEEEEDIDDPQLGKLSNSHTIKYVNSWPTRADLRNSKRDWAFEMFYLR